MEVTIGVLLALYVYPWNSAVLLLSESTISAVVSFNEGGVKHVISLLFIVCNTHALLPIATVKELPTKSFENPVPVTDKIVPPPWIVMSRGQDIGCFIKQD